VAGPYGSQSTLKLVASPQGTHEIRNGVQRFGTARGRSATKCTFDRTHLSEAKRDVKARVVMESLERWLAGVGTGHEPRYEASIRQRCSCAARQQRTRRGNGPWSAARLNRKCTIRDPPPQACPSLQDAGPLARAIRFGSLANRKNALPAAGDEGAPIGHSAIVASLIAHPSSKLFNYNPGSPPP
jgi:hypothetical protein